MKAVITVTGKDNVGIVAKVATECSDMGANIIDISQSVLREYFAMIVLVDIDGLSCTFGDFVDKMSALGDQNGLRIATMHEDIFNSMHRI
jgi:ACT domain-containing protein